MRLLRQEIALAKSEMLAKLTQIGRGAGELVAGGLILYAGFLVLLAAAVLGLSKVVEPWVAALIVGVVVLLVGLAVALKGRRDMAGEKLVPERTLRTLREDAEWAREQMR
jgi:xanthine/uracil permease